MDWTFAWSIVTLLSGCPTINETLHNRNYSAVSYIRPSLLSRSVVFQLMFRSCIHFRLSNFFEPLGTNKTIRLLVTAMSIRPRFGVQAVTPSNEQKMSTGGPGLVDRLSSSMLKFRGPWSAHSGRRRV
jgi:hypothetical protein